MAKDTIAHGTIIVAAVFDFNPACAAVAAEATVTPW